MDIRVLKYFVQVARDQSFTKAAEHLYVSQPALSKMIRKLENEVGVSLVDVQPGGVQLTDYGRELFQRAVPLLAEFDSLVNFVEHAHDRPSGLLRVGVTPMIATLYMVDIVTRFNAVYPDIEFQIIEDGTVALRRQLLDANLDLALCIVGREPSPELRDTVLLEEEMVAVLSVDNTLTQCDSLHFSQLAEQPLNLYTKYSALAEQIQERCVKAGFLPKINITSSKVNFMLQMTEHNRGISLLPRPYALRSIRPNLKIVPFTEPFPWQVCLTRNKHMYQSYIAQLFEDFVQTYFGEHSVSGEMSEPEDAGQP